MNNFNFPFGWLCLMAFLVAGCERAQRDLHLEKIWRRVSLSVVRVEAKSVEGETTVGSGFVCELNGEKVILSNRHVVLGAKEVRVGTSAEKLFRSSGYRISPEIDLALIDVPKELQSAPLKTRKNDVRIGERVFAIGFPLGLNKSITQGLVSSETEKLVQFDVETCVQAEMALPLGLALDLDKDFSKYMGDLDPDQKEAKVKLFKAMYAYELARVIQRHGSLEAGREFPAEQDCRL